MDLGSIMEAEREMSHTLENNDASQNRFGRGTCQETVFLWLETAC